MTRFDRASGNNVATGLEFPLPGLRQFLMPDQTVKLKIFSASTLSELEANVNAWVRQTQAIIAVVGPLSTDGSSVGLSLTYVAATEDIEDVQI